MTWVHSLLELNPNISEITVSTRNTRMRNCVYTAFTGLAKYHIDGNLQGQFRHRHRFFLLNMLPMSWSTGYGFSILFGSVHTNHSYIMKRLRGNGVVA
jgi:hypothetical protein